VAGTEVSSTLGHLLIDFDFELALAASHNRRRDSLSIFVEQAATSRKAPG
jgi:hypothetical protein